MCSVHLIFQPQSACPVEYCFFWAAFNAYTLLLCIKLAKKMHSSNPRLQPPEVCHCKVHTQYLSCTILGAIHGSVVIFPLLQIAFVHGLVGESPGTDEVSIPRSHQAAVC